MCKQQIQQPGASGRYAPLPLIAGICVLVAACSLGARAAGDKNLDSAVAFEECSIGSGAAKLVAQCAQLTVPIDPESADAGTLDLSIARIPARRQSAHTDVFTLLAGGPGQSAIESFPAVSFAFRHIMRDRDVILIDQRGTGQSAKLSCPDDPDSLGLEFDTDPQRLATLSAECLDSLQHNPRLFTTSVAVQDLELVRKALGVSQWNLYGISYGTRVAMHYLRRFPEAVRTMSLDAVVPPTIALGPDIGALAQRTLDLIFERCSDDTGCDQAFGDLRQPTRQLIEDLKRTPRTVEFEDVATGKLSSMQFTHQHLALTLRLLTYSSQTAAILPSMLHDAIANDNFAPLARQARLQTQSLGDSLATGMHHSIVCTEDVPFIVAALADPSVNNSSDAGVEYSYMGNTIVDSLIASCSQWPAGRIDDDFKLALESSIPTLILSGEADPITPPAYGDTVASSLENATHLVNPDQGHMQAPFGCMPVLLAQFVESANTEELDTRCLERVRALPFFVDANGPLP